MEIVVHRTNLINELLHVPLKQGCEIDIRSQDSKLILNHEPYLSGDNLVDYLDNYKHGLLVLNIKEAGIENNVLQLVRKRNISSFFYWMLSFLTYIEQAVRESVQQQLDFPKMNPLNQFIIIISQLIGCGSILIPNYLQILIILLRCHL